MYVDENFDNHLLVELVLRVDEFFIMHSFAFFEEYVFFNVMLHYMGKYNFSQMWMLATVKKGEAR